MVVSLLKTELLSEAEIIDTTEFYNGKQVEPIPSPLTYNISSSTDDTYRGAE